MFIDTTHRSNATEIMDDFEMEGALLRDTLDKLGTINKWLGGNRVTLNGITSLLKGKPKTQTYRIVDLGCGHGDMLRLVAQLGRKKGYTFQLVGVDANADTIAYAKVLSVDYPEISYRKEDIFSETFQKQHYDITLATLFLHHFKTEALEALLKNSCQQSAIGIVVNDLHRSAVAYGLFKIIGLGISNEMIRKDGLTSILRAFKRKDLEALSKKLQLPTRITWQWAFRYQWLIDTETQKLKKEKTNIWQ